MKLVVGLLLALVAIIVAMFVGISRGSGSDVSRSAYDVTAPVLPPADADWDYQLGGAAKPAGNVAIVSRDRTDQPVADHYNVCYVNGFQTQDSEKAFWRNDPAHWRLVLKKDGKAVVDSGWGEWLLDTRTAPKRTALAKIVGRWITGCAEHGYDAVELDNLDSFSRSKSLLTRADNKAFARLLVARGHAHGLAVAQKNWPELGAAGPALGFDFVVAEQCGQYHECAAYTAAYGDRVLAVEYTRTGFDWACSHVGDQVSVVRRDLDLTPGGIRAFC